ncbi:MAG TPA: tRNA preQ1(34) S-adenosylmethionine ribosyltransferase-isomerase QueA [Deltaproteobacteria bacterium]|nr:tRNA preQ1(34) S-adenosylmethionine ribosyltransferase-isomerase QueA [Deltaproteobacteria bacterium]
MGPQDFDYRLPAELIAQRPAPERGASRLMVLDRRGARLFHRSFGDVGEWLRPGDVLVLNDTRVMPARLVGRKATGGRVELLVVEPDAAKGGEGPGLRRWRCLVGSSRPVREGTVLFFGDRGDVLTARVLRGRDAGGLRLVEFEDGDVRAAMERVGRVPLPPYIRREPDGADAERYQTVFARNDGAVAAPTAGLHFTAEQIESLRAKGVEVRFLTLHTGPGTFMPVKADDVREHRMAGERYHVTAEVLDALRRARAEGRRVVAVGTTVTRALETAVLDGFDEPRLSGVTDLFIYPGFEFKAVDSLITNFHLPRSTLIMLVCAFAGKDLVMEAYAEAVRRRYRFYSYGDAMLIL